MPESIWGLAVVPIGLGLLGFVEPCSIGTNLLFIKAVEGQEASAKLLQVLVFALTRALFIGLMGVAAALAGATVFDLQKGGWMLLGILYALLGLLYLTGKAGWLMRTFGPGLRRLSSMRGTAGLGVLFGLNVPACAAPLLAALLGAAAVSPTASAARGFLALGIFGLALSLPLVVVLLWKPAGLFLDRISSLSARVPVLIGLVFILLGAWSMYFVVKGG